MRLDVKPSADKKLRNLTQHEFRIVNKKIQQILKNPSRYKPLRGDLHGLRRVHILKSFVLTYEVSDDTVTVLDYDHHDNVYQ